MMSALKPRQATTPLWHASEVAAAVDGIAAASDATFFGVQIDSRDVAGGDLFVAMPGTDKDGHDFVAGALRSGAAAALVRNDWQAPAGVTESQLIRCAAPKDALIAMATTRRDLVDACIIGVTGSAGKTGLKDALQRCLGRQALAHTNVRSFNNDVGVPLTMARMPRETQYGIFEMGMNHAGELTQLRAWVRPDIAVITTIAMAHYEFFESEEGIADAKAEIFSSFKGAGTAILPYDNRHFERLHAAATTYGAERILTFGLQPGADVRSIAVSSHGDCTTLSAQVVDQAMLLKIGIAGRHWVSNALAALAVIHAAGADLGLAGLSLADLRALPGRGQVTEVAVGAGSIRMMDDSYNANPASMAAALDTFSGLKSAPRGRRIAVLGDMLELGDAGPEQHAALLKPLLEAEVDSIICVGPLMQHLTDAAASKLEAISAASPDEALSALRPLLRAGDTLLVKGSNSIGLAKLVEALKGGALALTEDRRSGEAG